MKRYDFWKLSLLNIFAAPARSVLTVLGMAIGIGAILAVITLGDAGRAQVKSEMARLGIDRVWLTASEGQTLRHGDAQLLSSALDASATEQVYAPVEARAGRSEESCVLVGCSREYMDMMGTSVLRGRDLYAAEWQPGARSVLLGAALAEKLEVEPGELLSVSGVPFWVRGVIAQSNELSQVDASGAVFFAHRGFLRMDGAERARDHPQRPGRRYAAGGGRHGAGCDAG